MFKLIYRYLVGSKSMRFDDNITDAIETIEKFGKWDNPMDLPINSVENGQYELRDNGDANFKRERDGKIVYDIFRENLHIHVSRAENEKIYSIRVKNPSENWTFPYNCDKMGPDLSHPSNEYYEVYISYLLPVLDFTTASGDVYKHGAWDKYVYRKMASFFGEIRQETDVSKFNSYYR